MKILFSYIKRLLLRDTAKTISMAVFTQAMLSFTNFIVAVSIAKFATKAEYGIYVILFSIIGIIGTYQNALVNTPLTVLAPVKQGTDRTSFLSGLALGQCVLFPPIIILAIVVLSIFSFIYANINIFIYTLALAFATSTYLFREFIRTINYIKLTINVLLKLDFIFVLFIAITLSTLIAYEKVTSTASIIILGCGYLVCAIFGYYTGGEVYFFNIKSIKAAFKETWKYSRWTLIGVTSDIFKNRAYIYIIAVILTIDQLAEISIARLLLMPIGLVVGSTGKIILAKGANILHNRGDDKLKTFIFSICGLLIVLLASYLFILWLIFDLVLSFLGTKYAHIQTFVVLWSLFFLIYSIRYSFTNALSIYKEFKVQAKYDILSAIVTILACLILTSTLQGNGTIFSLVVGELTALLLSATKIISIFKHKNYIISEQVI